MEYSELLAQYQEYHKRLDVMYNKRARLDELITAFEVRKSELAMQIGQAAVDAQGRISHDT